MGYADYFGIPSNVVSIKPSDYVSYFLWILLLIILIAGLSFLHIFIYKIYQKKKFSIHRKLFFGVFVRSIFFTYILFIHYDQFESILLTSLYAIAFLFFIALFYFLDKAFLLADKPSTDLPFLEIIINENRERYFILSMIIKFVITSVMIFYILGNWRAKSKSDFLTYNDSKDIIICIYDNNVIVKSKEDFLEKKWNIKIVPINSFDNKTLTWKTIQK